MLLRTIYKRLLHNNYLHLLSCDKTCWQWRFRPHMEWQFWVRPRCTSEWWDIFRLNWWYQKNSVRIILSLVSVSSQRDSVTFYAYTLRIWFKRFQMFGCKPFLSTMPTYENPINNWCKEPSPFPTCIYFSTFHYTCTIQKKICRYFLLITTFSASI